MPNSVSANPPLDEAPQSDELITPADYKTRLLREYRKNVRRGADANHIWLNAFTLIRPTPATLQAIGAEVVRMLQSEDHNHVSRVGQMLNLPSMREVVIRVNAS